MYAVTRWLTGCCRLRPGRGRELSRRGGGGVLGGRLHELFDIPQALAEAKIYRNGERVKRTINLRPRR